MIIASSSESYSGTTARVDALKKQLRSELPRVCLSRARLITESYRQTEAEPLAIKQAKALGHVLSNLKIRIADNNLIVGDMSEVAGRFSEVIQADELDWLEHEADTLAVRDVDRAFISEEDKNILPEIIPFWKGRRAAEKAFYLMPEDLREQYLTCQYVMGEMAAGEGGRSMGVGGGLVAGLEDNRRVITQGLEGVISETEAHLKALDSTDPAQPDKIHFYRAVQIANKAVVAFALRYSRLAEDLADQETNQQRKAELREIAEICRRIPGQPARTFREALQSIWLVHIALHIEGSAGAWGRLDQYLLPFYRQDLAEGRLDREKAKELLQCFFIKLNSWGNLKPLQASKYFSPSGSVGQNITLGGVGPEGRDATNELSYLLLEADGDLCMMEPETVVRFHKDMPQDFAVKACEVARKCRGKIKFIGDNATIGKLMNQGHSLQAARDFAIQGCFEPYVSNVTCLMPGGGIAINLLLFLELALNNGVSLLSGRQLGPCTGNPLEFNSIEDILRAFRAQVAYFTGLSARCCSVGLEAAAHHMASPLRSSLIRGCLEKGLDINAGGAAYNAAWCPAQGAINVADSLAAIRKCVFDDRKLSMAELLTVLKSNFEGREDVRQWLLEAPKFGNDDDYADLLAKEVVAIFAEEWQKNFFKRGSRRAIAQLEGLPNIIPMGKVVGASADGRKSGETLADGGVSPAQGRNTRGVIATFNSVAKLDHQKLQAGEALNMRVSPASLKDERAVRKFATLVKTYLTDLNGFHCQFNFVSGDMLRDAQKNPEKFRDLLVRVSTYTAYFVELSADVQDNIISWTELGLS
jgi:pyruvate formate-lyase/glycerol dehydratase family glycyl radical enzyme